MTVAALIALLQDTGDFDAEVFLHPTVQPVDAVERCPGDPTYALKPYVVLRGVS